MHRPLACEILTKLLTLLKLSIFGNVKISRQQAYVVSSFLDTALLTRAKQDVLQVFAYNNLHLFYPAWVLVATWKNVTFQGSTDASLVSIVN